jgi:hypothetical protein
MGSSQSQPQKKEGSKVMEPPILTSKTAAKERFPTPTGHEYDAIDKIASELPNVIDDESRQQVADYKEACDNGKGTMVACFATGKYLSALETLVRKFAYKIARGFPVTIAFRRAVRRGLSWRKITMSQRALVDLP